ncbi:MAG: nucleotidyl transferase AbiEii/AbiGii toxin family protein [Planctomycetales bacterium]|nr:nucleotidyl transferase AbiEii/AbiGii toxin family protein [Planctomycetales bacterium]
MSKMDIAKSIHQRLLNVRDKTGEPFNNLLVHYGLERLLYRLVLSDHADSFVLKGALLFTLWHGVPGRPTRDIDLLGLGHPTHERLRQIFTDACKVEIEEDGLAFDPESIQMEDIRDDQEYLGVRIRMLGFLGNARVPIQIDVGFGDAVIPPPEKIDYPTILDLPAPRFLAYHPATVIAEKVNAMVVHGLMYSRMKDFYDIYVLLNHMTLDDDLLTNAIRATFQRRKIELPSELPVVFTPDFLADGTKETQWRAFLNRSMLSDFGLSLAKVLDALHERLWPILQKAKK